MPQLLPRAALAAHLETVELVQSLFPGDEELLLSDSTSWFLPTLRDWIEAGDDTLATTEEVPDELELTIQLALDQQDAETSFTLPLVVRLALLQTSAAADPALVLPDGAPLARVHAVQPSWMSRTSHDQLVGTITGLTSAPGSGEFASNVDLLLATIDQIRSMTPSLLPAPIEAPLPDKTSRGKRRPPATGDEPEYRVWFWFPSLSTREKRDDMVNWAPEYNLTGFVLAGKPALLCVEGTESNVQAYLSDIKANSWASPCSCSYGRAYPCVRTNEIPRIGAQADIPSFQKKVSERFRTPLLPPPSQGDSSSSDPTLHRLFTSMDEITSLIPRGGYRGHKPEMGDVRDFLTAKGLEDAFGEVVGGGQFS